LVRPNGEAKGQNKGRAKKKKKKKKKSSTGGWGGTAKDQGVAGGTMKKKMRTLCQSEGEHGKMDLMGAARPQKEEEKGVRQLKSVLCEPRQGRRKKNYTKSLLE